MLFSEQDRHWMQRALQQAECAEKAGEVPVGALLVQGDTLIAEGHNQMRHKHDPCAHAEINALRQAGLIMQNYRLLNTTLYVTLEPCVMCFGALVHARVGRVVYATPDPKAGSLGGMIDLFEITPFNHRFTYAGGLMAEAASQQLKQFFKKRRKKPVRNTT